MKNLLLFLSFLRWTFAQHEEQSFFFKAMDLKAHSRGHAAWSKNMSSVLTSFYDQTLDHFSEGPRGSWKQKYYINDEFFRDAKGPVFLTIGGEASTSETWMKYGAWYGYAEEVGALMLQLEHRFYGESHPTADMSVENMKLLTSQQALEDVVEFIGFIKKEYHLSENNKWVTFGGSYPGSLSLWMRSIYPELIAGSLSSSAPLESKVDFEEYVSIIDQDLHVRDSKCSPSVLEGIHQLEETLARGPLGWEKVKKVFSLCDGWSGENDKDVKTLFMSIVEAFAIGAQYDSNVGAENVIKLCSYMRNEEFGETSMERLARTVNIVYGGKCLNANYKDLLDKLKNEDWPSEELIGYRQWIFQTCNEFGWYQTGNFWGSFLPLSYFLDQCRDVYGPEFTDEVIAKNVLASNEFYGSKNPPLSNAIITHGSFDPWHPMGILEDMSDTVKGFLINGTSHCSDLYPSDPLHDNDELELVRKTTLEHIKRWMNEYQNH